jgi:predicted dehydrogenase
MKFGLVGLGAIGAIRANALRLSPHCTLAAVSDLDEARAQKVAPEASYFKDANDLIASDLIDAVIISAPPTFHESLTLTALAAGKHVLVEKPMAATPDACRRMTEAAKAVGKLLSVGYNHRYFDAVKRLRDAVQGGAIGTLSHIRAYAGHGGLAEFKAPWMYDAEVMGGGALMDNGTHILDMVRYVMGDATEVFGQATNRVWQLAVEDEAVTLLRRSDGATASVEASWDEWKGYRFFIEAYGDRGMVRASYAPMQYLQILIDKPGGAGKVERDFYIKAMVREKFRGWQSTVVQTFVEEFADFVSLATGASGATRIALAADGTRAVEVAHATYQSHSSGQRVTLPQLSGA